MSGQNVIALASLANAEHHKAITKAQEAVNHAKRSGDALNEAKTLVTHGEWGDWLARNFEGSERTAQRYMRLAASWPAIEAKTSRASDLSIRAALSMLACKAEPDHRIIDADNRAIASEVAALNAEIETADIDRLRWIARRATELHGQGFENRMRATRKIGQT